MTRQQWSIGEVRVSDAHTLSLVGVSTFLETFADILPGDDIEMHCHKTHSVRAYARDLRAGGRAWLARLAGTGAPVGYAMNTAPDLPVDTGPGDVELKRIYLLSRFHGAGIGKALLAASVAGAREGGAGRLLLGVYGRNEKAIGFYRAMGFGAIGTRRFRVGEGTYDDLIMALDF